MSVFSKIEAEVKEFFSDLETSAAKFCHAFVRLFKKAPAAEQVVQNWVNELAPIIVGGVALVDPVVEPEVAGAFAVAETGLAAIQASLTAANSGNSLLANVENFATTVPQLLAGLAIKNPALQATVKRIVALIVGEAKVLLPAIEAWVKEIAASKAAPAETAS